MKDQIHMKKTVNPNEIVNTLYSYWLLICIILSPYSKEVIFISFLKTLLLFFLCAMQRAEMTSTDRISVRKIDLSMAVWFWWAPCIYPGQTKTIMLRTDHRLQRWNQSLCFIINADDFQEGQFI